jgi:flagellin-like hook-associated protein FlgL
MTSSVILSAGVRQNLLALQSTADLMGITQNRLATGKKVNSALDNPINFFTSSSLNARAGDLSGLLDAMSNAIQTLREADNGITAITNLVKSAQALANQAAQSTGTTANVTGTVSGLTGASTFTATSGQTITVNDGTTTATFTAAGGGADTVQDFIDEVNNTANLEVRASLTGDGRILLEATGTTDIVIAGTMIAADKEAIGLVDGTTAGGTLNTTRSNLADQFDDLRTQIDQLAADSGFNGKNLLNGDAVKVTFNEDGSSSVTISGATLDSAGLGIVATTNTFQTDLDISDALDTLSSALTTLRSQAAEFGSSLSVVQIRQDFTKLTINTLQVGADALVLADTNEEGANMLALQTRQQLSTTALALSAQSDQAVLQLFG